MSGSGKSKEGDNVHRFPYYDLEAAIEVLGAFITSGIRDEVEALRQEVAAINAQGQERVAVVEKAEDEGYLSQREAARYLSCSVTYIRKLRQREDFPVPIQLSPRDLRWSHSALKQWAEARAVDRETKGSCELKA